MRWNAFFKNYFPTILSYVFWNMMLINNSYFNKIELINITSHELQRLTDIVIQRMILQQLNLRH